jgi:hypothetical protein
MNAAAITSKTATTKASTEVRMSPKEVDAQMQALKDLQEKVDQTKAALKAARDAAAAAKKEAAAAMTKKSSYTRLSAMVQAFSANPTGSKADLVKAGCDLYTANTGKPGLVTMLTCSYNNVKQCLAAGMTLPTDAK